MRPRYSYNLNNWLTHERVTAGNDVTSEPRSISLEVVSDASSGPSFETYTYNGFNQMIGMTNNNHEATYGYDVQGIRNRKTVDGLETRQITHEGLVVGEANSSGQVTAAYSFGINQLSANHGSSREYYLFNGHGDVVQTGDGSGNVLRNYAYDAFGNMASYDAGDENPFTYSGEYYDRESENYYLRARYYKPGIGRFISEDSYRGDTRDPLSLNLYTYTRNNPVMYVDPSGHREVIDAYGRRSHAPDENKDNQHFLLHDSSKYNYEMSKWEYWMKRDFEDGMYVAMMFDWASYRGTKISRDIDYLAALYAVSTHEEGSPINIQTRKDAIKTALSIDVAILLAGAIHITEKGLKYARGKINKMPQITTYSSTQDAANRLAKEFDGTVKQLKNGYKVNISNGNKPIVIRVMNQGSGGRSNDYFRVSINGKGSLTTKGLLSNDRGLTHIDLGNGYLEQIKNMITTYQGR